MSKEWKNYLKELREMKFGDPMPRMEMPPAAAGTHRHTIVSGPWRADLDAEPPKAASEPPPPQPAPEPVIHAETPPVVCLTPEAIQQDPWNAVALPLPEHASRQMLEAARAGARDFIADAMQHLPRAQDFQSHAYIEESVFEAYERLELISEKEEQVMQGEPKAQPSRPQRMPDPARTVSREPNPEQQERVSERDIEPER